MQQYTSTFSQAHARRVAKCYSDKSAFNLPGKKFFIYVVCRITCVRTYFKVVFGLTSKLPVLLAQHIHHKQWNQPEKVILMGFLMDATTQ